MMAPPIQQIAIIGFGEVGGIFGNDFAKLGIEVSVFDILLASRKHRKQVLAKARACGVKAAHDLRECLRDAELVISAVTPSSALDVTRSARSILRSRQILLDINSVSPKVKRKAASHIEKGGAHFVEAAVMAGVPGPRLKVPMLLGGVHARQTAERLQSIGMKATAFSDQVGVASAVKMCRSIMIKGLEALAVECLFAARRYGIDDAVLESLRASYPGMGWEDRLPDYLISRVAEHGRRRAAEMRQAAQTLAEVGVRPTMALATSFRQDQLVQEMIRQNKTFDSKQPFSWRSVADVLERAPRRRS